MTNPLNIILTILVYDYSNMSSVVYLPASNKNILWLTR